MAMPGMIRILVHVIQVISHVEEFNFDKLQLTLACYCRIRKIVYPLKVGLKIEKSLNLTQFSLADIAL